MTSTDDALLPFDTVCLVSHDSITILHADGLAHAAPKLLPIGSVGLCVGDEACFQLRRIPTGSSASPLLPRDLITLQHVASGHYLSNQTSAIALQPHAGAGASWEIGRTLAALGGAPLQTGEAVHVCSESSLLHLCSDTGGALHAKNARSAGGWCALRRRPLPTRHRSSRFATLSRCAHRRMPAAALARRAVAACAAFALALRQRTRPVCGKLFTRLKRARVDWLAARHSTPARPKCISATPSPTARSSLVRSPARQQRHFHAPSVRVFSMSAVMTRTAQPAS